MRNSLLIALREWKERISTRSFLILSIIGPLTVLGLIYLLFALGGKSKQHWNVLIADPANIMENKILATPDESINYSFANDYIEIQEFEKGEMYQEFDALLEINQKIVSNKIAYVFHREKPSMRMQTKIQYHCERRLEEIMVKQFTKFTVADFRKIKQPLTIGFRNVYDPRDESSNLQGWVGLFYGAIIFVFIFLFGMTILRSVTREKSNRIVEVLLGCVSPKQLMLGKIIGIGFAAFLQFMIWCLIIGFGLYFMRETLFPDMFDASNLFSQDAVIQNNQEQFFASMEYNQFVNLIYEDINIALMTGYFILFFIIGYFFYGTFFAAIGASSGSESDGQQFVLPLIFTLCFALYSGYYTLMNPESWLSTLFHYLPFTSPVVVMVKLAQGYEAGHSYELYLSLCILILSSLAMLQLAGRIYTNGILQFGHRVGIRHFFRWIKK